MYCQEQFDRVCHYYETLSQNTGFPSALTRSKDEWLGNASWVPAENSPLYFFTLENAPSASSRHFPILRHLMALQEENFSGLDDFKKRLRQLGGEVLVFLDSHNSSGHAVLKHLPHQKIDGYQKKLICSLETLKTFSTSDIPGVMVRSFIPGADNSAYVKFYNEVLGFLGTLIDETFVQSFCSRASFNSKGYFIAEYAGQMVGFLALEKEPWGEAGSQFGYIYQIGIASDFRRKNLASLLMLEARNFARQAGIQKLGVGVKNSNRAALEFFKKHGFQCVFSSQGFQIQIT